MLVVTGTVERVNEREAGTPGGRTWTERTVVVASWGSKEYVVLGRELNESGWDPTPGETVALECTVRPYVRKDSTPKPSWEHAAGWGLTATRRDRELEAALAAPAAARG